MGSATEIVSWGQFWSLIERPDIDGTLKRQMWDDLRLREFLSGIPHTAQYEVLEHAPLWVINHPDVAPAIHRRCKARLDELWGGTSSTQVEPEPTANWRDIIPVQLHRAYEAYEATGGDCAKLFERYYRK